MKRKANTLPAAGTKEAQELHERKVREWAPQWRSMYITPSVHARDLRDPDAEPLITRFLGMDARTAPHFLVRFLPGTRYRPLLVLHSFARLLAVKGQRVQCVSFGGLVRAVRELETLPGAPSMSDVATHRGKRHVVVHDFLAGAVDLPARDVASAMDWLYMHCLDGGGVTLGVSGAEASWPTSVDGTATALAELAADTNMFCLVEFA